MSLQMKPNVVFQLTVFQIETTKSFFTSAENWIKMNLILIWMYFWIVTQFREINILLLSYFIQNHSEVKYFWTLIAVTFD